MMRRLIPFIAVFIAIVVAAIGGAFGDSATLPPKLIEIHREYVRPGKLGDYDGIEADAAKSCQRLNCPASYLGITSITGPSQVWFVSWFDTYAAIEQARAAYAQNSALRDAAQSVTERKGALVKRPETLFAEYRPGLSYGSNTSLPAAHYFWIQIVKVLPGRSRDFEAFRRSERLADERAQAGDTVYVYHVTSGASGSVYLVLTLARSLQEADNLAQLRIQERRAPEQESASRLVAASVTSTANYLFRPEPAISYLPKSWTDADPDFWAQAAVRQ